MLRLRLCCVLPFILASGAHAERMLPATNVIVVTAPHPAASHRHSRHVHQPHPAAARKMPVCGRGGPASAYSAASGVAFAGRIDKITYQATRTIIVVRDGAGETCAYLPPRPELSKLGFPPALLRLHTPVMVEGFAHRTDKHKVLVQQLVAHPAG